MVDGVYFTREHPLFHTQYSRVVSVEEYLWSGELDQHYRVDRLDFATGAWVEQPFAFACLNSAIKSAQEYIGKGRPG